MSKTCALYVFRHIFAQSTHKDMNYKLLYQNLLNLKGSIQEVAKKAGCSRNTVRNTLLLERIGPSSERVKLAAIEYMQEHSRKTDSELNKLAEEMEMLRTRARQLANI